LDIADNNRIVDRKPTVMLPDANQTRVSTAANIHSV